MTRTIQELFNTINFFIMTNGVCNMAITGITCSGKTTLSHLIKSRFEDGVTILEQDRYFKNLYNIPFSSNGYRVMDTVEAFHKEEFKKDVSKLLYGGEVVVPTYDFPTNRRVGRDTILMKKKINIVEGLHVISLTNMIKVDIRVYVDVPMEVCLERRVDRDTNNYNITEEKIKMYWYSVIEEASRTFILPQKEHADIIIDGRRILC